MKNLLNDRLLDILVNRVRVIPVSPGSEANGKNKLIFLSDLAGMGYRITNTGVWNDSVLNSYNTIINTLKRMKGGDVEYTPLFRGFPNDVPDQNEYFIKRLVGFIGNHVGAFEGDVLDCGHVIPEGLFDSSEFSACPICQFQDENLDRQAKNEQKTRMGDSHTEWTEIKLLPLNEALKEAEKFLQGNLYAKSSIKESLKEDIEFLLDYFGTASVNANKVVFKEIASYITKFFWLKGDYDSLRKFLKTPTDILRLFAALTDSDVSLSANIKFPKFNRAQGRFILSVINSCSNPAEDLNTYRGLWLEIGRYLRTNEYGKRFPKAVNAFTLLRKDKVITFNSRTKQLIKSMGNGDLMDVVELLNHLSSRPGVFARHLHEVLERSGNDSGMVIKAFNGVADKVQLKNLFILRSYFSTIGDSEYRTIINKKGKIKVLDNRKNRIDESIVVSILTVLNDVIKRKIASEKESWVDKKVWIDPELTNYTVPLQQRKASDGLLTFGRGSRIKLDVSKVLRLFVYWKENGMRTDLDLSTIAFDENMKYVEHVSYTNLKSSSATHSGDIQSAPYGAAEFMDINLSKVNTDRIRYIAPQIYRYDNKGHQFGDMTAHAGWMIREKVGWDYESFDIKTVQNKFDLNGGGTYSIPILIDLVAEEIIFVDLYVSGGQMSRLTDSYISNVEGAKENVSVISKEVARFVETRPTMGDLARFNVEGRGADLVDKAEDADIKFGLGDCDYNVQDIEVVLSELL